MAEVQLDPEQHLPTLDVCKDCQLFWFDPLDYEQMPPAPPAEPIKPDPVLDRDAYQEDEPVLPTEPTWQWMFFLLGMPMAIEAPRVRRHPWATWTLTALITVVSLVAFTNLTFFIQALGLYPQEAWRLGGLTLLTTGLLHGDFFHLLGNMYFLLMFGTYVEDYLGWKRFLLLVLLADLFGNVLHLALDPFSGVPVIGASGGISGVIAFFALRFPKSQLLGLFRVFPWRASVWLWFLLWVAMQGFGVLQQMTGHSAVSALAHLGGVVVGVVFWIIDRAEHRAPKQLTVLRQPGGGNRLRPFTRA
jgi:membrane associated rhomboid family serine protease